MGRRATVFVFGCGFAAGLLCFFVAVVSGGRELMFRVNAGYWNLRSVAGLVGTTADTARGWIFSRLLDLPATPILLGLSIVFIGAAFLAVGIYRSEADRAAFR